MADSNFPLEISRIVAGYQKKVVLHGVDFQVEAGRIHAVLGPNGSGKSTLLKAALGLVQQQSGDVKFFGKDLSQVRRRVGYMPQVAEVDWDFPTTVDDVVLMGTYAQLGWLRRPGRKEKEIAHQAMETLGIADLAKRHISQLSGGQKQRVFVARILAQQTDLLLLDEPFAGVDVASELVIMQVLKDLTRQGKTVIVVHHDLGSVSRFCDSATLLNSGQVVSHGVLAEALSATTIGKAYGIDGALLGLQ